MNRTYLSVGNSYTDTDQKKNKLNAAIAVIEWHERVEGKVTLPMMQCMGLEGLIKGFGNNVDRYGWGGFSGGEIAGGFIYAIRNNYGKGEVKQAILYAVDDGVSLCPVFVDEVREEDLVTG